jgi:hypothetical protein
MSRSCCHALLVFLLCSCDGSTSTVPGPVSPPDAAPAPDLSPPPPTVADGAPGLTPDGPTDQPPGLISPAQAIQAAQDAIAAICTSGYQSNPANCDQLKTACGGTTPRQPYLAESRAFTCVDLGCTAFAVQYHYYLVPFDKQGGTTCVARVMASPTGFKTIKPGEFMAVLYFQQPVAYLPLPAAEAQKKLESYLGDALAATDQPSLVFYPVPEIGYSPYLPFWRFAIGGKEAFVTQAGQVQDQVVLPPAGG